MSKRALQTGKARRMQQADAEDLAQDACLRCWTATLSTSRSGPSVTLVAEGLWKDWCRRMTRERFRVGFRLEELEPSNPRQGALQSERLQKVLHRSFLRKCRRAGLSERQIALLSWALTAMTRSTSRPGITATARLLGRSSSSLRRFLYAVARRLDLVY